MDAVQVSALVVSILLLLIVLELVRQKKLSEEYSFVWIACAVVLIGLSLARRQLDQLALWFGIYYPPAALLLVLILFVFLASVSFSVVASRHRQQVERLIEESALLDARLRTLEERRRERSDGREEPGTAGKNEPSP